MAHKQLLHELLREDQEPFHLKTYVSDRRSQLRKSSSGQPVNFDGKTRKFVQISSKRCPSGFPKSACLFAFQNSPDTDKSPFSDFRCKSPIAGAAAVLRIPPRTAEILAEAAVRIQKQQKSSIGGIGSGLFGSLIKILKDRSKSKNRVDGNHDLRAVRGLNSGENENLGGSPETPFSSCPVSPFIFPVRKSQSTSGSRTPDFSSPAASPNRCVKQDGEHYQTSGNSDTVDGVEEKEQCSPVSVLDAFFEDDANESINPVGDDDGDDYDPECSYANMRRVKQQLLDRLRRFEKLAELDPIELERNFLDSSDEELESETVLSEEEREDEPLSMSKKQSMDRFLNGAFCLSSPRHTSMKPLTCKNRLYPDRMVENKHRAISMGQNEVFWGRICIGLDLSKEVNFDGGQEFDQEIEEIVQEVEDKVFGQLVEDLVQEFV